MCGDGTNDVGALKHADVGVAITNHAPLTEDEFFANNKKTKREKPEAELESTREASLRSRVSKRNSHTNESSREQEVRGRVDRLNRYLEDLQAQAQEQETNFPKLGDASIAAPFTSKLSSINAGNTSLFNVLLFSSSFVIFMKN